jgi:hypothetical protein
MDGLKAETMTDTNKKSTVHGLRPMETAPRNGKRFLIYYNNDVYLVRWIDKIQVFVTDDYTTFVTGSSAQGWLPLPTGETYTKQKKMQFGNGAIFVGCGTLKHGKNAFVSFKDTGISHNVGESRGETTSKDVEESEVLFEFYCADSINVVIRHLEEAKELMQKARGAEIEEEPTYTQKEALEIIDRIHKDTIKFMNGDANKGAFRILDEFDEQRANRVDIASRVSKEIEKTKDGMEPGDGAK